ncbi:MAG: hypothetical protein KAI45_07420, partial [Melioribacteraceae bacterium]|nr:hypothetical protein [Melioribacteraceae bacterium]
KAINFAFSTGAKLDVGQIVGRVYDSDPNGVMVFAYMKTDTFANPIVEKPKNISQVGKNGEFRYLGLANGTYRVFAVKEENKNRIYNIGEDMYGAPFLEITLTDSDSLFEGLNFRLTKEDTLAPYITSVTMTDRNHILIEYSENIDSSKVTKDNFFIVDSINQKVTYTKHLFQANQTKYEYFVTVEDSLSEDGKHFLVAENIFDKYGNEMVYDAYDFVVSTAPDTIAPSFKKIETGFEQNKLDYKDPTFILNYNDGITSDGFNEAVAIKYKENEYSFDISRIDDASYQIKILNKLKPNRKLELSIDDSKLIDAAGNQLDTIYTVEIETISGREFSGVSGRIEISDENENIVVVLVGIDKGGNTYFTSGKTDQT